MKSFLVGSFLVMLPMSVGALCVHDEKANLRQGPDVVKFPIKWEVIRYTPLEKLSKQKGWYRVKDVDGEIHWVREDLVTTRFQCAVVKEEFASLRSGPGTKYPKVGAQRADKYMSFRVVKTEGDWVKVEDLEGDTFWIHRPLLWIQ